MADDKKAAAAAPVKKPKKIKPYKPGKLCPKCSSHMAEHKDRYTCGKCGYTEWRSMTPKVDKPESKSPPA